YLPLSTSFRIIVCLNPPLIRKLLTLKEPQPVSHSSHELLRTRHLRRRPNAQASPHFQCDIKESDGRRMIPERIWKLSELADYCENAGVVPRRLLTGESVSRQRFGGGHGHQGAFLIQGNSRHAL